jgi:hypothetical protein
VRQHRTSAPAAPTSLADASQQRRRPSSIAEQALRKLDALTQQRGVGAQRVPPDFSSSTHSSTDEGVETDPETDAAPLELASSAAPPQLTHHLSSDSGASQASTSFSPFDSLECSLETELATSLPSCTSPTTPTHPGGASVGAIAPPAERLMLLNRHNPIGSARNATRSPVDFREGRRASDGLVAQVNLIQMILRGEMLDR